MPTLSGEIAIASATGLYFCRYDPVLKSFDLKKDFLMQDNIVTSVCETEPGTFFCGVWEHPFGVLSSQGKMSTQYHKLEMSVASETQCTDVVPVPDFDSYKNPFVFMRTANAI